MSEFTRNSRLAFLVIFLLNAPFPVLSQVLDQAFSFSMPWNDSQPSAFFPSYPDTDIDSLGFVSINDEGHFSVSGNPVRFWGGNVVAHGGFPDKDQADAIASRMKKFGVNIIRFHHIDNPWHDGSLFRQGQSTKNFNTTNLDRLFRFIKALKDHGIYINMNLHVSRTFNQLDGIRDADSLPDFSKIANLFDPEMKLLQKDYASKLLTTVNPYTGLALVNDPVMAMVEMINENSLYRAWHDGDLAPLSVGGALPTYYTTMLDTLWMGFLHRKYGSNDSLATHWNRGVKSVESENQLKNGNCESYLLTTHYVLETHEGSSGNMGFYTTDPYAGQASARVTVSNATGTAWHTQWKQSGLSFSEGEDYYVSFYAKADQDVDIDVTVQLDTNPWTSYAFRTVSLTTEWQKFELAGRSPETVNQILRVTFGLGRQDGNYYFDDLYFGPAGQTGLYPGENLESGNVKRINYSEAVIHTDNRVADQTEFYLKVQNDFEHEMQMYLKETLDVKVPITGTNWVYSGAELYVMHQRDYMDNHAYWDHPHFPNIPWSSTDWTIQNTSMVENPEGSTIPYLFAGIPAAGKPYTISEYNHGFPNQYQAEAVPIIAAYAAFHDADGIMFFEYQGGSDWTPDWIAGYFNIAQNPGMMAQFPAVASFFRDFHRIQDNIQTVSVSRQQIFQTPKNESTNSINQLRQSALTQSVRISDFETDTDFSITPDQRPYEIPDYLFWDPDNRLFSVTTDQTWMKTGFFPVSSFQPLPSPHDQFVIMANSDFGSFSLTSVDKDEDAIVDADTLLLTMVSSTQNTNMGWDGNRTVHNQWGTAPTLMKTLNADFQLSLNADSIRITMLNETGQPTSSRWTVHPSDTGIFNFTLNQSEYPSPWFGIEVLSRNQFVGVNTTENPNPFSLGRPFPNPFNPVTTVGYSISVPGEIKFSLIDVIGREVWTVTHRRPLAGHYTLSVKGEGLASGIYLLMMKTDSFSETRKLVLLK